MVHVVHGLFVIVIRPAFVEHRVAQGAIDDRRIDEVHGLAVHLKGIPIAVRFVAAVDFTNVSTYTDSERGRIIYCVIATLIAHLYILTIA